MYSYKTKDAMQWGTQKISLNSDGVLGRKGKEIAGKEKDKWNGIEPISTRTL